MWRSVFLHEFLDTEIGNFQALPGRPTPASLTLTPIPTPPFRTSSVQITSGRGFEYTLAAPLDQVIGVSCRVRLRFPFQFVTDPVPIIRAGMAEFRLLPIPLPLLHSGVVVSRARALLRIGPTEVDLGLLMLPLHNFIDLRFDWHTSGQARVLVDGELVAYNNAVAPAMQIDVSHVSFGLSGLPPSANPQYQIGRVFVRVLLRSDSLSDFSRLLPVVSVPDDDLFERCRLRVIINLLAVVDRLRQFMTLVNQRLSQPWSQQSGPSEGPFSREAKAAHALATKAVVELGKMLRTSDFSTPENFLEPFTEFLRILHDALPEEFEALTAELIGKALVPQECRQVFYTALEQGKTEFGPLLDLFSVASERVREIAGGS